jgi:hypothetical protein
MKTALLFGIPQGYVDAARGAIQKHAAQFENWAIKYHPAGGSKRVSQKDLSRIEDFVNKHEDLHIVGFSDDSDRQRLADQIELYFRFRWFNYEHLKWLTSPAPGRFAESLAVTLSEELEWAARVKPSGLGSPLLLPETVFKPEGKHQRMWRYARAYGDMQNVIGAEKAIKAFQLTHHRKVEFQGLSKQRWIDDGDRIFGQDGPWHGVAPYPRNWKYSYKIEPGFHFDVTHLDGRKFSVQDSTGRTFSVKVGSYINVDPHGYVLG